MTTAAPKRRLEARSRRSAGDSAGGAASMRKWAEGMGRKGRARSG